MLKKIDVYDYLNKVQTKAVNAVKENYEVALKEAIEECLNQPKNGLLKASIDSMEHHVRSAIQARDIIKKYVPSCSDYFHEYDMRDQLFGRNDWRFPKGFDSIRLVHAEYEEKIRKTREEYAKIRIIVQSKKTGDKGRTALIALGFDVSYLDKLSTLPVAIKPSEIVIDKSLIFPCGKQGI